MHGQTIGCRTTYRHPSAIMVRIEVSDAGRVTLGCSGRVRSRIAEAT